MSKQKLGETMPKCCANCANRIDVDGYLQCKFDSELLPPSEDIYYLVCNWFKPTKTQRVIKPSGGTYNVRPVNTINHV